MNIVVLYDSQFGNTKKIALAIAEGLKKGNSVSAYDLPHSPALNWKTVELLVLGSPVQGGQPTQALRAWMERLPPQGLHQVRVAAFDTRFEATLQNRWLQILMKVIGYAADKMAKGLQKKGGVLVAPPMGFIVEGTEGPLKDGELARARAWGMTLTA